MKVEKTGNTSGEVGSRKNDRVSLFGQPVLDEYRDPLRLAGVDLLCMAVL
jgi:hypothetical protein